MRNHSTDVLANKINSDYANAGITPEELIEATEGAFDITIREDYLAFHIVEDSTVYTIYMWRKNNYWNVKA
jgi:hypothetical protein